MNCYCGSKEPFNDCCEPYITGRRSAITPETLMRSRYSAYVVNALDYLLATWHPDTRPQTLDLTSNGKWLGLTIISKGSVHSCSPSDNLNKATITLPYSNTHRTGFVEFIARFKPNNQKAQRLHETSYFIAIPCEQKQELLWHYHSAL